MPTQQPCSKCVDLWREYGSATREHVAFLKEQEEAYRQANRSEPRHRALTDFCQVLLGLNEFVYID